MTKFVCLCVCVCPRDEAKREVLGAWIFVWILELTTDFTGDNSRLIAEVTEGNNIVKYSISGQTEWHRYFDMKKNVFDLINDLTSDVRSMIFDLIKDLTSEVRYIFLPQRCFDVWGQIYDFWPCIFSGNTWGSFVLYVLKNLPDDLA